MRTETFSSAINRLKSGAQNYYNSTSDFLELAEMQGAWDIYDSELLDYERQFKPVLPEKHTSFYGYLKDLLGPKAGLAVGLEVGGPGTRLFNGLKGIVADSAGVVIKDWRKHNPSQELIRKMASKGIRIQDSLQMDLKNSHTVLEGNIFLNSGQQTVKSWLGKRKADIFIEKFEGARWNMPKDRLLLLNSLNFGYRCTSNEGVMFLQLPVGLGKTPGSPKARQEMEDLMARWQQYINTSYKDRLEMVVNGDAMRLNKLQKAPDSLPFLR